ncbi:fatty acyl CoA synthetase [Luteimonas sp. SJ-92]|uniref:Fatty acyl CoA synthetase n=1 Tax=Luteimonas salinisoli TaxID=2752307 RepID=A0A853JG31_9GAMM|nr:LolA-related protein [Luteimonas salinisoli]NZA27418.1 fatty acyl CoA synthetase [Luteimonas salinisoli]
MTATAPKAKRRHRTGRAVAALLCVLAPCWATAQAAPDGFGSAWVLEKLARPPPARTSFLEVRASPMLKEPLRVAGEYLRPDERTLVREVRTPYAETTTLRDGRATIARAGRSPRSFALSRAPELAALQGSFGALLAGDAAALERHYAIETRGVREGWRMTLTPRDEALAASVREIVLHGRGAELRCIETQPAEGALQRTLLAGAARSADAQTDAAALEALCRGGG